MKSNIFTTFEETLSKLKLSEAQQEAILKAIVKLKKEQVNLMITGATGSGKSSTINALFDCDKAKVGIGVDPETMDVEKYNLDNLILWDTPGLGDGTDADQRHGDIIKKKLQEKDKHGNALIDLVIVVLDGSSKDLGTSYDLINNIIIPTLGAENKARILIAINQADVAMKGRYWDHHNNKPQAELINFLNDKVTSIQQRVKVATGVDVEPIYYSAGYKEGTEKQNPYNLSKLLYFILHHLPEKKRFLLIDSINDDTEQWVANDREHEYNKENKKSFQDSARNALTGAVTGGVIGMAVGGPIGAAIGSAVGAAIGLFW